MRALHWFRSDLRLFDNTAFIVACQADHLIPVLVFDNHLLRSPTQGKPRLFEIVCVGKKIEHLDQVPW